VHVQTDVALAELTTLRLGGPARRLLTAETDAEVVDIIRSADAAGEQVLVMGGGSNLVVADAGFDGTVVRVATTGVRTAPEGLVFAAGIDWDQAVELAVHEGYAGVEALAGIPGTVGATPIQNVGAYGQDVAQTVTAVRALDRRTGEVTMLGPADCRFSYRHSVLKDSDRYVVLDVTFALPRSRFGAPVRYAELARHLGVGLGGRAPTADVRAAVLDLRRRKGMVLDAADHDTWSAGSFFTNPVLDAEEAAALLPAEAPRWPERDGKVKTSAAWLIERAGFRRGYGGAGGPAANAERTPRVRLSAKHPLALTNRGGGTTAELLALAREIRDGVRDRFGITLITEPVLVGVTL